MFHQLIKYLRLFSHIQSAGISKEIHLRANFIVTLSGSLCFFYLHLISFRLIINRFHFPGWDTGQLWVLLFTFQIFTYLAFFLFWRGLNHTPRDIGTGGFDVILAKPASARFIAFFRNGSLHNLPSALLGAVYLSSTLIRFHLPVSFFGVVLYLTTLLLSLWIFHCLTVLFICLNFRHGFIPGTSSVVFEIQEIYKYPANIFTSSNLWLRLLILPLSLLTTLPASAILLKPLSPNLILTYVLLFLILTVWSHLAWTSSLRHYSSASS